MYFLVTEYGLFIEILRFYTFDQYHECYFPKFQNCIIKIMSDISHTGQNSSCFFFQPEKGIQVVNLLKIFEKKSEFEMNAVDIVKRIDMNLFG